MEHQTLQENSNESIQQFLNTYRSRIQSGELQFIDNIYKSNTISSIKKYINGWIIKTAIQDGILQELVNSERILLVGSGYIPYSLIHLNKHYPEKKLIGIDNDEQAVKISRKLIKDLDIDNIGIVKAEGTLFNYSKYMKEKDLIYISSDVINISEIINTIESSGCLSKTYVCLPKRKRTHY